MKNFFNGAKGISSILTLLVIVIILAVIFFIRANISIIPSSESETSETERTATSKSHDADIFNLNFTTYQGPIQTGTFVKSMILKVKNTTLDNTHKITIIYHDTKYNEDTFSELSNLIKNTNSYSVSITGYSDDGYTEEITIKDSDI